MPGKFKSVVVKEEERFPNGRVIPGKTVWIPINEAAKASPACQSAIDEKVYTPKDGEEPNKMAAKLKKREQEAAAIGKR